MPVSDDALLDAIETSLFLWPEIPGLVDFLDIPGIRGRKTTVSHPLANIVGASKLDSSQVEGTIAQVEDIFADENKAFGWVVGPLSEPGDLSDRLAAAGLIKADEMAGLALTDLNTPIRANPSVWVEEVDGQALGRYVDMIGTAYGMPEDVAQVFIEQIALSRDQLTIRSYVAHPDNQAQAVAFSFAVYIPDTTIVLLGGAGTLPEYRGQGIYSSLVARRLADARADGMEAAVLQAVRSTSAPICMRMGFRELGGLEFYIWMPSGTDEAL